MNYRQIQQIFPQLLGSKLCQSIVEQGRIMDFAAETPIMDYGRPLQFLPLILKGGIRVLRKNEEGEEIFLYFLQAGETCAMSLTCCMERAKSEVKAIAEEDTTLLMIPLEFVDKWMLQFPSWKKFVMGTYRRRFNEMLKTIDSIAFSNLDSRLLVYLQEKSSFSKSKSLNITHQSISNDLNCSREGVSRLLKKLEKEQKIKLGRNKIELLE